MLKFPSGLPAPELCALQKLRLSFSLCLLWIFALWAVWHWELFINMKLLFLFLVTVATMLCSTGRLQILVIHWVNLITVFMKHSLLLLICSNFWVAKDFSDLLIVSVMPVLCQETHKQVWSKILLCSCHLNKYAGKKRGEKCSERDWRFSVHQLDPTVPNNPKQISVL